MRAAIVGLVFLLAGCGAMRDWVVDTAKNQGMAWLETSGKDQVEGWVASKIGEEGFAEIRAQADTDQSGDTTWEEWKNFILSGGFMTVLAAWINRKNSRKRGEQWEAFGELKGEVTNMKLASAKASPPSLV